MRWSSEGDEQTGAEILKRALQEPLRQLVANAGLEGSVVVEHVSREKRANWGFDVMSESYVDLRQGGHHRSGQGHAQRARERRQRRGHDSQHRSAGYRPGGGRGARPASGRGRNVRVGKALELYVQVLQSISAALSNHPASPRRGGLVGRGGSWSPCSRNTAGMRVVE